ncbi:hypothetical protein DESC_180021 [Desulfosarcina cetonica]|nr:hypothetical protein DESC_180021 [Desulfosarcina cetonica]
MDQAGLLTYGSLYNRAFPTMETVSGFFCGVRPRLQRRARPRFPRGSLFCSSGSIPRRGGKKRL